MEPSLIVAASKAVLPKHLNTIIADCCLQAIKDHGAFSIALSGGSLPSFLSTLKEIFDSKGEDPKFDAWHIILADERCVPSTDDDSNLKALRDHLLSSVPIPSSQVHGINEKKLVEEDSIEAVATDYEEIVKDVLSKTGGQLDLAVLGFGPDGHTCSLFPNHALLQEQQKLVASINDSPKPPPNRITLTLPVLNTMTKNVIFCGAGKSKSSIISKVFENITLSKTKYDFVDGTLYTATMAVPHPFPCAMVYPSSGGKLTWVVDADAMEGIPIQPIQP